MQSTVLVFNQTPIRVVVGLFQGASLIIEQDMAYRDASAHLIPTVQAVLNRADLRLSDLSYLVCNIGPAPFTTLRTVIVTVNGLGFGSSLPLIGVNGLLCLLKERHRASEDRTYMLLKAFGGEIYYGLYEPGVAYQECRLMSMDDAVQSILSYASAHRIAQVRVIGNAAHYRAVLEDAGVAYVELGEPSDHSPTLQGIAAEADHSWKRGNAMQELRPYYGEFMSITGYAIHRGQ